VQSVIEPVRAVRLAVVHEQFSPVTDERQRFHTTSHRERLHR
jgi:hypothetical protein